MPISCTIPGVAEYAAVAWGLVALGYAVGLALYKTPTPGGQGHGWGGYLMSYSLVSAAFLAVVGSGAALQNLAQTVIGAIPVAGSRCTGLPDIYMNLGIKSFSLLGIMAGIGFGTALIPIVGPAIASLFSVVATFPGLALSATLITSFTLVAFLIVFGSLAVMLVPLGVVLMGVPAGKLKGLGAWFIAAALAFTIGGPFIPVIGEMACSDPVKGSPCNIGEILDMNFEKMFVDAFSLVLWIFDPNNNVVMRMWRFALGSLFGWGIVMAAAAALSKAIGGVAASIGFG